MLLPRCSTNEVDLSSAVAVYDGYCGTGMATGGPTATGDTTATDDSPPPSTATDDSLPPSTGTVGETNAGCGSTVVVTATIITQPAESGAGIHIYKLIELFSVSANII